MPPQEEEKLPSRNDMISELSSKSAELTSAWIKDNLRHVFTNFLTELEGYTYNPRSSVSHANLKKYSQGEEILAIKFKPVNIEFYIGGQEDTIIFRKLSWDKLSDSELNCLYEKCS